MLFILFPFLSSLGAKVFIRMCLNFLIIVKVHRKLRITKIHGTQFPNDTPLNPNLDN